MTKTLKFNFGIVGELEEFQNFLNQYNISIRSDTMVEKITCYNNNGSVTSELDYLATSLNFAPQKQIGYIRFHTASDHVALQTSVRCPSYLFSPSKTQNMHHITRN